MPEATGSIMLLIPSDQISLRHPNNLMRNSSIIILDNSLSMLVPLPARNQVNPEVIVNTTEGQPRQFISDRKRKYRPNIIQNRRITYNPMLTAK